MDADLSSMTKPLKGDYYAKVLFCCKITAIKIYISISVLCLHEKIKLKGNHT